MCLCKAFSKFDNCIVSLRTKIILFCWWTLLHGLVCSPLLIRSYYTIKPDDPTRQYSALGFLLSVIHFYAGILLFLAVKCNLRKEFMFGVVLSNFLPVYLFIMLFIAFTELAYMCAFQIVFNLFACRYYSTEMKRNQYSLEPEPSI